MVFSNYLQSLNFTPWGIVVKGKDIFYSDLLIGNLLNN